jgi:hypothetical protein
MINTSRIILISESVFLAGTVTYIAAWFSLNAGEELNYLYISVTFLIGMLIAFPFWVPLVVPRRHRRLYLISCCGCIACLSGVAIFLLIKAFEALIQWVKIGDFSGFATSTATKLIFTVIFISAIYIHIRLVLNADKQP